MSLTFHEPTHTYFWLGQRVPNVTSILEAASDYGMVSSDLMEAARDRGTFVHKMCEYDDLGDLDPSEEQGTYAGYLKAWRSFMLDYGAEWSGIEERGYSRLYRYAGTMDRRGVLRKRHGNTRWVIDLKTSVRKTKVWGLQTAAYRQICAEEHPDWALAQRATVQVRADGKYQFVPWPSPLDLPAFLGLKTFTDWTTQ